MLVGYCTERIYKTSVVFLLPLEGAAPASIGSTFGIVPLRLFNPHKDTILAMLRSRRMAEDVVREFDLVKGFGTMRGAIKAVRHMVTISPTQLEIELVTTGKDPELITDIANFYVTNLEKINDELDITAVKRLAKVLDPALKPETPESRQIIKKTFMASMLGAALGLLLAFIPEFLQRLRKEYEFINRHSHK